METLGPYELLETLGEGGSGVVWRARHRALGREVALKVVAAPGDPSRQEVWRGRFMREAQAVAQLSHPNIVGVHEVLELKGRLVLVQELVPGRSLRRTLAEGGAFEPPAALVLVEKIARAVHHAHTHGILHRDLKPDNVLVDEQGEPRVIDFGLAKSLDRDDAQRLTRTGALVGTPAYFSPEQARGEVNDLDVRSDVYSLGLILYELLAGVPPYAAADFVSLLVKIMNVVPPAPRTPAGASTGAAGEIALRALAKDRDERPATALALAEACAAARLERAGASRLSVLALSALAAAGVFVAWLGLRSTASDAASPASPVAASPTSSANVPAADTAALARARSELAARFDRALDEGTKAVAKLLPALEAAVARDPQTRAVLVKVVTRRGPDVYKRLVPGSGALSADELALGDLLPLVDETLPESSSSPALEERERALEEVLARRSVALSLAAVHAPAGFHDWLPVASCFLRIRTALPRSVLESVASSRAFFPNTTLSPDMVLRVHALSVALEIEPSNPIPEIAPEELARAAVAVAAERPRDPVLALGCAHAILRRGSLRPLDRDEAADFRELVKNTALPLLGFFRAEAESPALAGRARFRRLRAIERVAWGRAVHMDEIAPSSPGSKWSDVIAAYEAALELGYPDRATLEAQLQGAYSQRAGLTGARADFEASVSHARAALDAFEQQRTQAEELVPRADSSEETTRANLILQLSAGTNELLRSDQRVERYEVVAVALFQLSERTGSDSDRKEAFAACHRALALVEAPGRWGAVANVHLTLACLLDREGKYAEAIAEADHVLDADAIELLRFGLEPGGKRRLELDRIRNECQARLAEKR